jgi:hypothetical protein
LAFGSNKSKNTARIRGTVCQIEIDGVLNGGDGTSEALLILVSVTCTGCAVIPSAAVIGVATVQVVPVGAVQVNPTLWLNPPSGVIVALNVIGLFPICDDGAVTWKSHPVPVSGTVCGLPGTLSVTVNVPVRAPMAVGANVMLMVQVAPAARVAGLTGQVLVWAKSPEATMELIVNGPRPALVSFTGIAALVVVSIWPLKGTLVGSNPMPGVAGVPVPVSGMVWGLPGTLSVTVNVPVRAPTAVGANVILMVQVAPAARVAGLTGQVFVWAKSPEATIELIVKGPRPALVSITGIAALVVVSIWPPKGTLVGFNPIPGAVAEPVPVRFTVNTCVLDCPPFVTTAVITRLADSAAATEGVNVTLIVHVSPAARLGLHASDDFAKSVLAAGDEPVTTILLNVTMEPVLFVTTNGCGALITLSCWIPKSNVEGEMVRVGISESFATYASVAPLNPTFSGATGVPTIGRFIEEVWPAI